MGQPLLHDRVMETSTTTGTGTYTLAGAVLGYDAFSRRFADGSTVYYCAVDVDGNGNPVGNWETGIGTLGATGTTLARTAISESSNADAAVSWAAGTRRVFLTYLAKQGVTSSGAPLNSDSPTFSSLASRSAAIFKGPTPWVDVLSDNFTRLCSASSATTTGTIGAGSNSLTVSAISDFVKKHGVYIVLDNGAVFTSYITLVSGLTVTLADNAPSAATAKEVGHDDTLAIQDAINFSAAATQILIPAGTYNIHGLTLKEGYALVGAGIAATILKAIPGASNAMLSLSATGNHYCQARFMTLDGNKSASIAPTCNIISFTQAGLDFHQHVLTDLRIQNGASNGISLSNVCYTHFTDIFVYACNGHGVVEDAGCFFNQYNNVQVLYSGLNGFDISGDADAFTNVAIFQSGQVDSVTYGANIRHRGASHGHTWTGFWVEEALRVNIEIDCASGGGWMNMVGTSHQNNAAQHVRLGNASNCRIILTLVPGVAQAALSVIYFGSSATRNYIDITYDTTTLAVNAPPIDPTGPGVSGNDNYVRIYNGSKLGSGDIVVTDCEQLVLYTDVTRNSPSTLWRYPGSSVWRSPS